jgi:tungstate transport system substrate-binding protein
MNSLRLATTTSVADSGLLSNLIPGFEKESGYTVVVLPVGSGAAINMAREGKADVILVHDPDSEQRLVSEGYGINRKFIMHNDFILAGPGDDPANTRGSTIQEAFTTINRKRFPFISRDDSSGTDRREKSIWQSINIDPRNGNYQTTKSGMGEALAIASSKQGYILTDRATYLSRRHELNLDILVEGEDILLNLYHLIETNPAFFPNINAAGARAFSDYMTGSKAQSIIGNFMKDIFGRSLFIPDAHIQADQVSAFFG